MQVYDLAWSPSGEYILAGSTDNCARVFTAVDGSVLLHSSLLPELSSSCIQVNVFMR